MGRRRRRVAGILLHPTSLPGRWGIGDLGDEADRFLDWARSAGVSLWQVLPLGPTTGGDSPYNCASAFAGNPLLVSPDLLVVEGLLAPTALEDAPEFPADAVRFDRVRPWKERLLRSSWEHVLRQRGAAFRDEVRDFAGASEQRDWLPDWALFAALKDHHDGAAWMRWDRDLVLRDPSALARARRDLASEIEFHGYVQFLFDRQWRRARREANARGIAVLCDAPIYVALDSCDVWARPELYLLDDEHRPLAVAGVPPDYFSDTGQRWGNPLYRWDRMAASGFEWWIRRVRRNLELCDLLRIDHFRAFSAYWAVPAEAPTAATGEWRKAPGRELFDALRKALGDLPIVAEDLGTITDDVEELLAHVGIPGMKVLQFAFYELDSAHLPHRHEPASVVYTGTHDNDTTRGWFAKLEDEERARVLGYIGGEGREIAWDLVRVALTSVAERAIVPLQDVLDLGSEARMNDPSTPTGNWRWRAPADAFREDLAARVRRLVELSGRRP